ncbi:DUF2309 domain-containing protein [Methylococcus sp. EFPC2]|nr:DUF2309 domain-containing protein [Methylococcus sp. EFPC2]
MDHVLPGQAPLLDFVHHNTLHGYQHLPFPEALAAAERLTGNRAYLPEEEFRRYYRQGRINDADLASALDREQAARGAEIVARVAGRDIARREIWLTALIHGVDAGSAQELDWQIAELQALETFQADVPEEIRRRFMGSAQTEVVAEAIAACWATCSERCDVEVDSVPGPSATDYFADVGDRLSLRGALADLTGEDILDEVRPALIRLCASHLDEGIASWHAPDRPDGLYAAWKACADHDAGPALQELPGWRAAWAELPEEPVDAVMLALQRLGIPEPRWSAYLRRLALELPGWSGLFNWRQHKPAYPANRIAPVALMDYLALRLLLDGLRIERLCRSTWGLPGRLDALQEHFTRRESEFTIRLALFAGKLPEDLAVDTRQLIVDGRQGDALRARWDELHERMVNRRAAAERSTPRKAWRLFRLAQHLGLSGPDIAALQDAELHGLLSALDELDGGQRGYLWLCAYEHHYRNDLFAALAQNHGRGPWATREGRPDAQVIFCMDDREESLRRHLEESNPAIETLGAAGFFGVPMNWRGLDDKKLTPLCPVVVTPAHEVREIARPGAESRHESHGRRLGLKARLERVLNQEIRRNLISSELLIGLLGPLTLGALAGKIFFPLRHARWARHLSDAYDPPVPTRLHFEASADSPAATPERPRLGFTDGEQADRVGAFLRNVGLTAGFARLVVIAGHGSISQNNPHLAAYDCGACSGRHGGPNARTFAAMANRPEIRALLKERGIDIPPDTWFLGCEHNTANEDFIWFDLEDLPAVFEPALRRLRAELDHALHLSAHERCRRLASAPRKPSLKLAMNHIVGRTVDFSQARPELGHATNAAAVIGRRSVTRGAFFDRRVFLISYDPTQDPDGRILEGILLAAGPVGAGINLEYYFSTVDNERYGCGSKVPHNVTGLNAVMEGASSDLRTGLPRQMVEIHEAMRLQLVVEAKTEVLVEIYKRQPPLRELIGNRWLLLSAIAPDTGTLSVFEPERGFVPWQAPHQPLPRVARSTDWYAGHSAPRPPALIATPEDTAHAA